MQIDIAKFSFKPFFWSWACCYLIGLTSCQPDTQVLDNPYRFEQPEHFPVATYTFHNNELSKEGFELGKKLFFDPILSIDSTVSCGTCHNQSLAFADQPLHHISVGVDNKVGTRNALPLHNLAFYKEFFWDGGVTHLDFVPINAIESPVEMNETITNAVQKVGNSSKYQQLFYEAFGSTEVSTGLMMDALAQFMLLMVSDNSKYDQHLRGTAQLTTAEARGLALVETHCQDCHSGTLFTNQGYHNNGINATFDDLGRALISANPADEGKFRVPSLRNVGVTMPYMHNAKFNTLEEVLQHYTSGVQSSATLDPLLIQSNGNLGIPLNTQEQADVIAFLHTLTDYEYLNNPLFFQH